MARKLKLFLLAFLASALIAAAGLWLLAIALRPGPTEWAVAAGGNSTAGGFSIMSFNISLGGRPAAAALDAVEEANTDIVCIQELTPGLAEAFEVRFSGHYPHRLLAPGSTVHGIGIASKLPLQNSTVIKEGMAHLPAAIATVMLGGERVRIACVHLIPPHARPRKGEPFWDRYVRNEGIRMEQASIVLDSLGGDGAPAIVLGDMNEWEGQAALSLFAQVGFTNACEVRDNLCGASWPGAAVPSWPALFRIDHILGRGVRFADAAVLEAGGSDHFPAVARIILPNR